MTYATISVTPSGKACLDHVAAGLIAHAERSFITCTMPACPAPRSSEIVPHWVPDAAIIAAMNGGAA
tara:strand:- start:971 stop:1171 length:201 start_codon:yes stop_codon:yes gene_type:complete